MFFYIFKFMRLSLVVLIDCACFLLFKAALTVNGDNDDVKIHDL